MDTHSQINSYLQASAAVRRRVGWVRFARWMQRSHWIVGTFAIGLVLVLRRSLDWRENEIWPVVAVIGAWLLAGFVLSLLNRPGVLESFILLDRSGGWKDRFSSAWAFLNGENETPAEQIHVEQATAILPEATRRFPESVPIPSLRWAWLLPTAAIALAILPLWRIPTDAEDLALTEEMLEAAASQAEELTREAAKVKDLASLSEEEKEELSALRVDVDDIAEQLADADGLTAGEMLEALESRARAAERLAEKLGLSDEAWASAEMIEEMERHPDTANLALAVKDKAAAPAAVEAMELFEVLDNPEIARETSERMTGALESIMANATEADSTRPVGERVGNASTKMLASQPKTAAREFEELAKHFRFLETREEAQERLEELANSLRDAGSEISGSELEQMEKIASENRPDRSTPGQLQSLDSGNLPEDLQKLLAPQMAQSGAQTMQPNGAPGENPKGDQKAPVPGLAKGEGQKSDGQQEGQSQTMQAPIPGENPESGQSGQGMSMADKAQDGKGEGGMLSAPIPGMNQGETAPGAGLSPGGGQSGSSGQGGDQAGTGTAELVDSQTDALKATKDSEVLAQINADGESTIRAVEGQARQERANRTQKEIMTDFISAEEQALDGKSLPLSRREHVIRYFSAIRRQFEDAEKAP